MMLMGISACKGTESIEQAEEKKRIKVVTTIFPEYDWVRNVAGEAEGVDILLLLDSGVDLHSFQPTAEDIMNITNCDLFIYVGGESDEWVEDALKEAANENMKTINLLEAMGDMAKEEEVIDGMQEDDHDHEHDSDDGDDHEHEGEAEYDEHVWLSLKNASFLTERIAEVLSEIDPENGDTYKSNAASYIEELKRLDGEYTDVTEKSSGDILLFGDRFPFRYLTDDYGLTYYAAFAGCSAETEASFETIKFLADKTDEYSLKYIMTIEGSHDTKLAETIIQSTKDKDQEILSLDSMQSTTSNDAEEGATYISIMEKNLKVLEKALN